MGRVVQGFAFGQAYPACNRAVEVPDEDAEHEKVADGDENEEAADVEGVEE
jgi:hypothetical protein